MKQVICFAVIVIALFGGMVIVNESGRRPDAPQSGAAPTPTSGQRKATISVGEKVKIEDHLAKDRWTVVQFTADW